MPLHKLQLDNLKHMRELLSEESRWTKGAFARDEDGKALPPAHGSAVCFCLLGAYAHTKPSESVIKKAGFKNGVQFEYEIYRALHDQIPDSNGSTFARIPSYQDKPERTHAEILQLLDRTISYESRFVK